MQVWLRLLVVWFIALALPVQGVASATMAHCGPRHQPMHMAAGAPGVPQAAQPHAADVAHAHHPHRPHDEGAAAHSTGHPEPAPHAAAEPGKFTDLGTYKCSSCASCCAGTALTSAMPEVPDSEPAPTVFAEATVTVTVDPFASDGPDRPPRRTHAA